SNRRSVWQRPPRHRRASRGTSQPRPSCARDGPAASGTAAAPARPAVLQKCPAPPCRSRTGRQDGPKRAWSIQFTPGVIWPQRTREALKPILLLFVLLVFFRGYWIEVNTADAWAGLA